MNTLDKNITFTQKTSIPWLFWMITLALSAGLILSVLSWMEICVEHCSANQDYYLFGMPFAFVGMGFFSTALCSHLLSHRYEFLSILLGLMIAAAFGSEIRFIAVQKYEIGHWCPVCLSVALTVGIVGLLLIANYFKQLKNPFKLDNRGQIMDFIKKGLASLSFAFIGFLMAFVGISKQNYAEAAVSEIKDKLAFGNKNSPVEVYFVTDWFCPSCRKVEPLIERIFPKIQSKVAFYFIDYPIHKHSLNFTPYNLAFLINDRQQYMKARDALMVLTTENESPNDQDIMALANQNHLNFRELSFMEVKAGMEFFEKTVEKYNLNSTPVLIITNVKNNKTIKLDGRDEITEANIMKAIESANPSKDK
jgi:thiol-disulfide isomerase/thioredoxin